MVFLIARTQILEQQFFFQNQEKIILKRKYTRLLASISIKTFCFYVPWPDVIQRQHLLQKEKLKSWTSLQDPDLNNSAEIFQLEKKIELEMSLSMLENIFTSRVRCSKIIQLIQKHSIDNYRYCSFANLTKQSIAVKFPLLLGNSQPHCY